MLMNRKKIVLALCIGISAFALGEESALLEMHSGWCWYPYSSYYYPPPYYRYYAPWGISRYHRDYDYYDSGYSYPPYWYDYPYYGYPWAGGGFCFQNRPYIVEIPSRKWLSTDDLPRPTHGEPGSAPVTLRNGELSLQEERLNEFLAASTTTNKPVRLSP